MYLCFGSLDGVKIVLHIHIEMAPEVARECLLIPQRPPGTREELFDNRRPNLFYQRHFKRLYSTKDENFDSFNIDASRPRFGRSTIRA